MRCGSKLSWPIVTYFCIPCKKITKNIIRDSTSILPTHKSVVLVAFIGRILRNVTLCYSMFTEKVGSCAVTLLICLGCARFASRRRHRISWLRSFVVFLSHSREMPGQYPKLGYNRCDLHNFELIIH
jgi:hypothetical protein